jgi:hypothetical protein
MRLQEALQYGRAGLGRVGQKGCGMSGKGKKMDVNDFIG